MTAEQAHRLALRHLTGLQRDDGSWEGEMVWNTMILSQYVIVRHVVGRPVTDQAEREDILLHYRLTRTGEGGWGMHPESGPYVFFTTLAYVALRLLGVPPGDPLAAQARAWLHRQPGGVQAIPTWGKLWLSLLGLYHYDGVNPFPPELFLLPRALPAHPDRLYCHTRAIYQALAYLYGRRFHADPGALTAQLRTELHGERAKTPDAFAACRDALSPADTHVAPSAPLRLLHRLLLGCERAIPDGVRQRALSRCLRRVVEEQRATGHLALSPVNGLLNCLVLFAADPRHPELGPSLAGLEYWRWRDPQEGIRYCGARSHSWDTAFALEALTAGDGGARVVHAVRAGAAFLSGAQLTEPLPAPAPEGRAPITGGWCFSEGGHRWPVSDCTAEALAALAAAPGVPLPPARMAAAAAFILDRQNRDGGFGTYEARRGPRLLEALNPSEMYARCMVEGSYAECTGSALTGLARAMPYLGGGVRARARDGIRRGTRFLLRQQLPTGAFPAVWGVHHTYGTFMAVRGLRAAGLRPDAPELGRAAAWVRGARRPDGGWGEHYSGCLERRHVAHPRSQPVMTAWAVLALLFCGAVDDEVTAGGVEWLRRHQNADGSWTQEAVTGVFFGTAMLHYRLYAAYFPAWALGAYLRARAAE
ncbi:2,3-oxidosqualene cyclase [Nonomuraea sp. PA05]|uniref:prenyltransferase/squalene oxidase repeat-containing protein n=1 Tax=Nonomuraea sp. PA05 TaxID=2604466 RepID=UPI0011D42F74|nr:prenyltransferase/squalene oxidase repeat-containing protein [Nonomuraea sp. PA05]TYB50771.1 2,3-oxidosqualene cyclase [Nonomuraea sp. PA05]